MEIVEHAAEDDFERCAVRTLPAPESELLEEHLLICQSCRDRLESTGQHAAAMRSAAATIRQSGTGE